MKNVLYLTRILGFAALFCVAAYAPAFAQDAMVAIAPPPPIDTGSTAWMIVATILVLMMTIPGLALFYGGMVNKQSVLSTLMQSFVCVTLVTVLWIVYGYSLIFTEHSGFIGGMDKFMHGGITAETLTGTAPAMIPETVFSMFQMTFGIITCALIFGAVATRIKFSAALVFIAAWFTLVYIPVAHWVWGPKGMLGGLGIDGYKGLLGFGPTLDFAGGTVVHINAGIAGLVAAFVLKSRKGFLTSEIPLPYNIVFSVIGACLLWVGWFGFNAGSAVAANGAAGMAMLVTQVATATASLSWMTIEWIKRGKPSALGIISGAVAGLVAITPACGFVDVSGALIIGAVAGVLCFFACSLKFKFKVDDSLDVFGVHCVGGIVGALLTGLLATSSGSVTQFFAQCEGVAVTILYCGAMSYAILTFINVVMGARIDEETEYAGIDLVSHGEMLH